MRKTEIARIHPLLYTAIKEKQHALSETIGVPVSISVASKKLAEDHYKLREDISRVRKEFPLYKRLRE